MLGVDIVIGILLMLAGVAAFMATRLTGQRAHDRADIEGQPAPGVASWGRAAALTGLGLVLILGGLALVLW